jgi:Na+-driven multidrug efflux pump
MAAQNIGAERWDRLAKISWAGIGINSLMSIVLVVAITIFARPLLGLFLSADSPAIPIGVHMNHIVAWIYIPMGISMVIGSVVRANGAVLMPFIFLVISAIMVRFAFAFGFYPHYGADAIWWSSVASALSSLAMTAAYYLHGGWRKKRLTTDTNRPVMPSPEPV